VSGRGGLTASASRPPSLAVSARNTSRPTSAASSVRASREDLFWAPQTKREPPKDWEKDLTPIATEIEALSGKLRSSDGDKGTLQALEAQIASLSLLLLEEDKKLEARVARSRPALAAVEDRRAALDEQEERIFSGQLRVAGAQRLLAKFADDVSAEAGHTEEALEWLTQEETSDAHYVQLQQLEHEHSAFMISLLDPDGPACAPLPAFMPYAEWRKAQRPGDTRGGGAPGAREKALTELLTQIRCVLNPAP
jgi:hypothetical protein